MNIVHLHTIDLLCDLWKDWKSKRGDVHLHVMCRWNKIVLFSFIECVLVQCSTKQYIWYKTQSNKHQVKTLFVGFVFIYNKRNCFVDHMWSTCIKYSKHYIFEIAPQSPLSRGSGDFHRVTDVTKWRFWWDCVRGQNASSIFISAFDETGVSCWITLHYTHGIQHNPSYTSWRHIRCWRVSHEHFQAFIFRRCSQRSRCS